MQNKLYYGDCLEIMRDIPAQSVDLIYLDPPFNSNRSYNTIYQDHTGRPLPEQVEAFCDIWEYDATTAIALKELPLKVAQASLDSGLFKPVIALMQALKISNPRLLAYLVYMTERLIIMKQLLKPTGSIYFHCDPGASHYIKIVMDAVFGYQNFINEIIWYYKNASRGKKRLANSHDILLHYSETDKYIFNRDDILMPFESGMTHWRYTKGGQADKTIPKGKTPDDVIVMPSLNTMAKERLGYPTQKPLALIKRIILASSNAGDMVLDPFCGCATTIVAAHELKRRWIGIDIAYHAITKVVKKRLKDIFLHAGKHYVIDGVPKTEEAALDVWQRDPYQFQRWAIEMVEGFVTTKRSYDRGIDGRLYFRINNDDIGFMVLEVKGGKRITIAMLRQLIGVMQRENAHMAGLIISHSLSKTQQNNFNKEILAAGVIDINGKSYPRLQILTLADILAGKTFDTPAVEGKGKGGLQSMLYLSD